MALQGSGVSLATPNEVIDKALELGITDCDSGGVSSAGVVRLAREYGVPVYGCFGTDMAGNEGPDTLRLHLSKGYPLVVVSRMNLIPDSVGHAQCIAGIDGDNNVLIHDPYSSISHRQTLRWRPRPACLGTQPGQIRCFLEGI